MAKNFYRYFNYHYWLRKFSFSLIFQKYFFISKSKKRKIVFNSIYKSFHWRDYKKTGENESVSGLGSDLDVCEKIIKDLTVFIEENEIRSILDLACGDFNWMKFVINNNPNIEDYCGVEIVDEIVSNNNKKYSNDKIKFTCKDVIKEEFPVNYDLVIVRDFFIHIKNDEIKKVIEKIKKSNAKFFGINSYPVQNNVDLKAFGHHRHINIELEPFGLNKPYLKLNDYDRKFNIYKI